MLWECKTKDCCGALSDSLPQVVQNVHTRLKGIDVLTSKLKKRMMRIRRGTRTGGDVIGQGLLQQWR